MENYQKEIKEIYKSYVNGDIDSEEALYQMIEIAPTLKKVNFDANTNKLTVEVENNGCPERFSLPYKSKRKKIRKRVAELVSLLSKYTSRHVKQGSASNRNKIRFGPNSSTNHKLQGLEQVVQDNFDRAISN
ncbi:hypothetical protein GF374_02970 [Candidatus Woesearchaeota archaeon]|nr:hypothetical protein [Candidatus Woesearchaeota archaeon]